MADNTGAPAPFDPPYETLDAQSSPLQTGGRKRGLMIGVAVVGAAVLGAGAWAATSFLSGGADVAEGLPDATLAYATIDLDPGGKQQVEAYQTLKKFPSVSEQLDKDAAEDFRKQITTWLREEGDCPEVDFAKDVEPWVGTTAALGAVDLGEDTPTPFGVVQVTDAAKAEAGVKKLAACGGGVDGAPWSIDGDWATFAETESLAGKVAAATKKGSLADNSAHKRWMDELGDLGMVTFYISPDAPAALTSAMEDLDELGMAALPSADLYEDFEGAAATVRFADGGLELAGAGSGGKQFNDINGEAAGAAVAALPDDTLAAFSYSVTEKYADLLVDMMKSQDEEMISSLEDGTGLSLPEDLATLLGKSMTASIGGDIDIDALVNSADPSSIPFALRLEGDGPAIDDVITKLESGAGLPPEFTARDSEGDLVVLGPNADYRSQVLAGGKLGDGDVFRDVVPEADNASVVFYLDFDAADDWLYGLAKESGDDEVAANVKELSAFGMSVWQDDDVNRMLLRLTTD
ncbi:MAG: hypothetical protein WAW88_10135 [Nocardioides sp.]